MACFTVTAVEALVVSGIEKHNEKIGKVQIESDKIESAEISKIPMNRKLKWLSWMLWGGTILLAFEHVWHGEVVPWYPFLTAMSNSADAAEMFHEMATVGVAMAALITVTWFVMCKAADAILAGKSKTTAQEQ